MRSPKVLFLLALLALGSWLTVQAQPAADEKTVTMNVEDEPVAVAAKTISEQTGIQVAVTENTDKTVSGGLENAEVEKAVRLLAEGADASWIRGYIIEKEPPEEPYTAEELLEMLQEARTQWFDSLTDEERQELMATWRQRLMPEGAPDEPQGEGRPMGRGFGMRGFGAFGPDAGGPGGGVASMAGPEGPGGPQPAAAPGAEGVPEGRGGPGGRAGFMRYEDPIRRLLLPARSDTISLDLTAASLEEALSAFTAESCFLVVVADEGLEGEVTVQVQEGPLSEALDAIAAAADAEWRMFYVIGQPRELTDAELAERQTQMGQRRDQRFTQMWGRFWQMTPEERAASIQRRVERIQGRLANLPPERMERFQRRISRTLGRMTQYSATLSTEQRLELKPLLQALAKAKAAQ